MTGTSSFAAFVEEVEATATPEELRQLQAARSHFTAEAARIMGDGDRSHLPSRAVREFTVYYERTDTGNYVKVRARTAAEAVAERCRMLTTRRACADGAKLICDGQEFPIAWDLDQWRPL